MLHLSLSPSTHSLTLSSIQAHISPLHPVEEDDALPRASLIVTLLRRQITGETTREKEREIRRESVEREREKQRERGGDKGRGRQPEWRVQEISLRCRRRHCCCREVKRENQRGNRDRAPEIGRSSPKWSGMGLRW